MASFTVTKVNPQKNVTISKERSLFILVIISMKIKDCLQKTFIWKKEDSLMDEYKPFDMVHKSLNKTVVVALKDGRFLKGRLIGYDTELNLSMDNAEIYNDEMKKKLGVVVIRKNNVLSFTPGDTL